MSEQVSPAPVDSPSPDTAAYDVEQAEMHAEQAVVDRVYLQLEQSTRNAQALAAEGHDRGRLGHEGGLVERDAMVFQAAKMEKDGRLEGPLHVQFVMGVKNAMPVDKPTFDFYVETLKRIAPNATWTGAGIGPGQLELNRWSLAAGGHCRTGLEDNVRWDKTSLAPSNAALVKRVAELCAQYGRPVATPAQARKLLSLA